MAGHYEEYRLYGIRDGRNKIFRPVEGKELDYLKTEVYCDWDEMKRGKDYKILDNKVCFTQVPPSSADLYWR